MIVKSPAVMPKFDVDHLVRRRSFVLRVPDSASQTLLKLLFSSLYATTPTVHKKPNRDVPVGTVIFDPDGEYFWPDDTGRPGLLRRAHLEQRLVVFTNKKGDSPFYQSFVAGPIKLDIRRLPASSVVSIAPAGRSPNPTERDQASPLVATKMAGTRRSHPCRQDARRRQWGRANSQPRRGARHRRVGCREVEHGQHRRDAARSEQPHA